MGRIDYRSGRITRATARLKEFWQRYRESVPAVEDVASGWERMTMAAGLDLAELLARTGDDNGFGAVVADLAGRSHSGTATRFTNALALHSGRASSAAPSSSQACGAMALWDLRRAMGISDLHDRDVAQGRGLEGPMTLSELEDLARAAKMDFKAARRPKGAPVPWPSVIHWKFGHYAAVVGRAPDGGYPCSRIRSTSFPVWSQHRSWPRRAPVSSSSRRGLRGWKESPERRPPQ